MKKILFQGCATAVITPMSTDGSVNFEEFGKILDFQIDNGIDGIIVCGTTGESSTLTDDEHKAVIKYCVDRVNKRVPVIAGTGSNDTAYALELSLEAKELGADGLLLVTPYYNKTTQDGLIKHFNIIADKAQIPCILYNVPSRTGMDIAVDTYKALSENPNIVAVKEANPDVVKFGRIINACGENLTVYSGNDDNAIATMSIGGKGLISVISNVLPKEITEMTHFALEGNFNKAAELHLKYLDFMDSLFCEVNPIPVKKAMELIGFKAGCGRLPLCEMKNVSRLTESMKKIGILN
ncbi:MAG: 4-hydroxy-tetrahydrodipicolinate synthase [Oscillospiraceae bacterium]|jgi:4-hydroxy-tetrahydrodipicolinate synthase|nr:4-hydroxy-tetrahydrodipicolinate synthase [Oscillospiraceae bacterium]